MDVVNSPPEPKPEGDHLIIIDNMISLRDGVETESGPYALVAVSTDPEQMKSNLRAAAAALQPSSTGLRNYFFSQIGRRAVLVAVDPRPRRTGQMTTHHAACEIVHSSAASDCLQYRPGQD